MQLKAYVKDISLGPDTINLPFKYRVLPLNSWMKTFILVDTGLVTFPKP